MSTYGLAKLLDQIWTNQVIAAPTINDGTNTTIFDNEKRVEQIMAL